MASTGTTNRDTVMPGEAQVRGHWLLVVYPWLLVVMAWGIILFAFASGYASLIDHDYLLQSGYLPWLVAFAIFLISWQVMIAAMMLPSALLMISSVGAIGAMGRGIGSGWLSQGQFILGYTFIWSLFACVAFLGDTLIHQLVNRWYWLYTHSWFVGATILLMAGGFQFSALKRSCLQHCRKAAASCNIPLDRDIIWQQGMRYGLFCVGACWAIMLVMFGIGMKSLLWMVILAGIVLVEKEIPGGQRFRVAIGVGFLSLAILWLLLPLSG